MTTRPSVPARAGLLAFALCLAFPASAAVLRLKTGPVDPAALRGGDAPDSGIAVVQLAVDPDPGVLARLRAAGAAPLEYLPDRAYVVRLRPGAGAAVRGLPDTRWLGALLPEWKVSPDLGARPYADPSRRDGGMLHATADLFAGEPPEAAAAAAASAGAEVLQVVRFAGYARLKLRAPLPVLRSLAAIPAISWIEEAAEITPRNATATWVVQSNQAGSTPVWDRGLHGEGQIVGHIDGRIDMNSCYVRDPANNTPGPAHRKVIAYRSAAGLGADSHGTHVAGTVSGDQQPVTGFDGSAGHAWAAKISHSNLNDIDGSGTAPSNLYAYLLDAHEDGARVHTNSWGDDGTTAYTTWCVDIDRFMYDHEESLVVFASTNQSTLKTPENAKNVLAVGATQNGVSAGNHCYGGTGPTVDGRRKPEIYAPGCGIVSAQSSSPCGTTSKSGTSMATPAVSGAGALVRQYFAEGWYPTGAKQAADARTPSGALVKATLLNGTVDMTGLAGYPGAREGWGRVLLEDALHFAGESRRLAVLADVPNGQGLTTGLEAVHALEVEGPEERLKITLAWTEPPASLLANPATVNDLDLEVVAPDGTLYLGNGIDTATGLSVPGGSKDPRNNVEMVIVGAPAAGTWTVRVRGAAVNVATQGFALVATGRVLPAIAGALQYESHQVQDAAPLGNGDGVADPGETVVVPIVLRNRAGDPVTGISGTLRESRPDVQVTREDLAFPDLAPGASGGSLSPHARVSLSPTLSCGSRVPLELATTSSDGGHATGFALDVGQVRASYPAAGLPLDIPKNSAAGVSSSLQVSDAFTLQDVQVAVDVAHQDVGELRLALRSPSGTQVVLHARSRAGTQDVRAVYDRERAPDGPGQMNDFDGEPAQGTWTLTAVDDVPGGTPPGALRAWSLELAATTPLRCTPLSCGSVPAEAGPVLLAKQGGDVLLTWPPVPGASGYRVWRAAAPDFSAETLLGTATGTSFVHAGALADPAGAHYEVRAVNGCEQEGP